MSKIINGLYLGSYYDAINEKFMKTHHISAVLNVAMEIEKSPYVKYENYMHLKIDDEPHENLLNFIKQGVCFIHKYISSGKNVFVHCHLGKSRSVAIIRAYLMIYNNMTYKQAKSYVKTRRHIAEPNPGFETQLNQFEKKIKKCFNF